MNYGIAGQPLGHSLSPILHNWALARSGLPGRYLPYETKKEDLAGFIDFVRKAPLAGVSVTVPHKVAVMDLIDGFSDRAARAGAVNTLYWKNSSLFGENTDVVGFKRSVSLSMEKRFQEQYLDGSCARLPGLVLILGAGGAARGVLCGLAELAFATEKNSARMDIAVAARNREALEWLSNDFSFTAVDWPERADFLRDASPDLVINATPLGMSKAFDGYSPIPSNAWLRARPKDMAKGLILPATALDLVYNPLHTPFLCDAAQAGWNTVTGLEFFAAQGLEQFKIWTGRALSLPEATKLLATALAGWSH